MKYRYYSGFTQEKDQIDITFPDLKGCITFGDNLEQALHMSKEALEGYLLALEDEKMSIPKPSTYQELQAKLNDNQQLQLISVDTDFIRRREENKAISKLEVQQEKKQQSKYCFYLGELIQVGAFCTNFIFLVCIFFIKKLNIKPSVYLLYALYSRYKPSNYTRYIDYTRVYKSLLFLCSSL